MGDPVTVTIALKAVLGGVTAAKWFFEGTHSNIRGRVATYYRAATLECNKLDRIFGRNIYTPLFSPSNGDELVALKAQHGERTIKLLENLHTLVFSVMAVVSTQDFGTRFNDEMMAPTFLSKLARRVSFGKNKLRRPFKKEKSILSTQQYFTAMEVSDKLMLPMLAQIRRRVLLLEPDYELVSWLTFKRSRKATAFCDYEQRRGLINVVVDEMNKMLAVVGKVKPNGPTPTVELDEEAEGVLNAIYQVLREGGNYVESIQDDAIGQLLREKLIKGNLR